MKIKTTVIWLPVVALLTCCRDNQIKYIIDAICIAAIIKLVLFNH